jgi:DNA-directed RNA polymerase
LSIWIDHNHNARAYAFSHALMHLDASHISNIVDPLRQQASAEKEKARLLSLAGFVFAPLVRYMKT